MGKLILAEWLEEDYKLSGNKLVPKKEVVLTIKIKGESETKTEKPTSSALFIMPHKAGKNAPNPDLIVAATPTLTHPYCLYLAGEYDVKIIEYNLIHDPADSQDLYGYMETRSKRGTVADGEVHKNTLNFTMYSYPHTVLRKRAEDRLILRELGLYQYPNLIYSQEEFAQESGGRESGNVLSFDEIATMRYKTAILDFKKKNAEVSDDELKNMIMNFLEKEEEGFSSESLAPEEKIYAGYLLIQAQQ